MSRLLLLAAALCACAHPPPPPPPSASDAASDDAQALVALREEARELIARQSELAWRRWAFGENVDLAGTYVGHERLFMPATIALARRAAAGASGDAKVALEAFHLYLVGERVAAEVADLSEKIGDVDPQADPEALARVTPLYVQRGERIDRAVREVGFPSRLALAAALRRADLAALRRLAEELLARSDEVYLPALGAMAQRSLGKDPGVLRRADVQRLFALTGVDAAFPAGGAFEAARRTFAGMGIDLGAQPGLRVDQEPRPHKDPRAVALAVRVPDDVRVSVKPQGGPEDYRSVLHELGHAEHFLFARVEHWELALLGNSTATEAYAQIFEGLTEDVEWLGSQSTLAGAARQAWLRDAAVRELYLARGAAAKVLFELEWRGGGLADPAARWRELGSRASGVSFAPEGGQRYLVEQDDFLESADELRARLLAAQIEGELVARFGETWWTQLGAGELLRGLWAEGNRLSADEVARRIGAPGVAVQPLVDRLRARL